VGIRKNSQAQGKVEDRDVRHTIFFTLLAVAAFAFISARSMAQSSKGTNPQPNSDFMGNTLTCNQLVPTASDSTTIHVPVPLVERAKVKARLAVLLRDSLYDDATGIVNIAREREIKKLASKLN
jgi:hypothetical protein